MDRPAPFSPAEIEHARRAVVDNGFFWSQVNAAFDRNGGAVKTEAIR